MNFIEYLQDTKQKVNYIIPGSSVRVVIGNESCDLDSMVAALALAYYYSTLPENRNTVIFPMMNKPKNLFPIRIENVFVLNRYNISPDWLIFRDTIFLEILQSQCDLKVTIVDHHVLPTNDAFLKTSIDEIIDHRLIDSHEIWDASVKKELEPVGSCCSLIARRFGINNDTSRILAGLLYDVITYDTIAYKVSAGKVKPLDLQMAEQLEKVLQLPVNDHERRLKLFNEIWAVHKNISQLTSEQLLYKDLKIVGQLFVPGLPMLVKQYLKRSDAKRALDIFCRINSSRAVLLMGLEIERERISRDLALYTNDDTLATKINNSLIAQFEVEKQEPPVNFIVYYYRQKNTTLSRKQLIPLIQLSLMNIE